VKPKAMEQLPLPEWTTGGGVDRADAACYIHLIRRPDDPERGDIRKLPEALRDRSAAWRRAFQKAAPETYEPVIESLLGDHVARTFNRICVELFDKTADVMFDLAPDHALWNLVRARRVEHTMHAPILFRRREAA
jgi:hypothetical protein